jgi:hypothetical protein
LVGNVWEWTSSATHKAGVLRGGAYPLDVYSLRIPNHEFPNEKARPLYGLRVCADLAK